MICILGNCQAQEIFHHLPVAEEDKKYFQLSHYFINDGLKSDFASFYSDIRSMYQSNELKTLEEELYITCQPSIADLSGCGITAFVLSMPHELESYRHKENLYYIRVDKKLLLDNNVFGEWVNNNFHLQIPSTNNFWTSYARFIRKIRKNFPSTPIIIVKRLSPHRVFGPNPKSWLRGWDSFSEKSESCLRTMHSEIGNLHVIDMDDVVYDLLEKGHSIQEMIPHLRIEKKINANRVKFILRRDIEHVVPFVWREVGRRIDAALQHGFLKQYSKAERDNKRQVFSADYALPLLDEKSIIDLLCTSGKFNTITAIAHMLLHLPKDLSGILLDYGQQIPVQQEVLNAVKIYFMFNGNNRCAREWCSSHKVKAVHHFKTAGSHLYSKLYISLIDNIFAYHQNGQPIHDTKTTMRRIKTDDGRDALEIEGRNSVVCEELAGIIESNQSFYLWGAGGRGRQISNYFMEIGKHGLVKGFIDSNKTLWGSAIDGINIFSPDKFHELNPQNIIIASAYEEEIAHALDFQIGYKNRTINSSVFLDDLSSTKGSILLELE